MGFSGFQNFFQNKKYNNKLNNFIAKAFSKKFRENNPKQSYTEEHFFQKD